MRYWLVGEALCVRLEPNSLCNLVLFQELVSRGVEIGSRSGGLPNALYTHSISQIKPILQVNGACPCGPSSLFPQGALSKPLLCPHLRVFVLSV